MPAYTLIAPESDQYAGPQVAISRHRVGHRLDRLKMQDRNELKDRSVQGEK